MPGRPKTAKGQKRKSSVGLGMSAFGGKAEVDKWVRTWIGERVGSGTFMQYVQANGAFIERGPDYQIVGTVSRIGDMLCLQSPALLLGRQDCGPIFRNPSGTPEQQDEYTYPNAYALKQFSATP